MSGKFASGLSGLVSPKQFKFPRNGFLAFAKKIVKAWRNGETAVENAATFEDGYKIQLLLDAARKSGGTGAAVKL